MTEKTKEKKKKVGAPFGNKYSVDNAGGRPKSDIDWKRVDELLEADCSGAGIAAILGIAPCTLYDRCLKDKGISFSEYSQQKNSKGESLLKEVQYLKAMSGDNTLLVWLGKVRLKQKEYQDEIIKQEVESKFEQLMKQMEKDKANNLQTNDDRSSIPETA
jgi:predicted metal-binding transcription factor (methanogenesis marker protein 9)